MTPQSLGCLWWNIYSDPSYLNLTSSQVNYVIDAGNGTTFFRNYPTNSKPLYESNVWALGEPDDRGAVLFDRSVSLQDCDGLSTLNGDLAVSAEWTAFSRFLYTGGTLPYDEFLIGSDINFPLYNFTFVPNRWFQWKRENFPPQSLQLTVFTNPSVGTQSFSLAVPITADTWVNIAARVYNSGPNLNLEIWSNGLMISAFTQPNENFVAPPTNQGVFVGREFDGYLAEQFWFNRKLTNSEMVQMFDYLDLKYNFQPQCIRYCNNNLAGSVYISGTTCDSIVGAFTLNFGECLCMLDGEPIILCDNPTISGTCLNPTPTPFTPTPTQTPGLTPTPTNSPTITSTQTASPTSTPATTQTSTPSVTPTNTATPSLTPTLTPTPSCNPFTTQYMKSEISGTDNIKFSVFTDPAFTINTNAVCDYEINGTYDITSGSLNQPYTTIMASGDHQHTYNTGAGNISGFTISSVSAACPCVNVIFNQITPTPTATQTQTASPTLTPTNTPSNSPTQTPSQTATQTETPSSTPTNTPSITPSNTSTPSVTPTNTPSATPPLDCSCYLFQNEDSSQSSIFWTPCGEVAEVSAVLGAGQNVQHCVNNNAPAPSYTGGVTTILPCSSVTTCTSDGDCEGCS